MLLAVRIIFELLILSAFVGLVLYLVIQSRKRYQRTHSKPLPSARDDDLAHFDELLREHEKIRASAERESKDR